MEPLNKRIQTIRLELNMTQADFGAELGITRSRCAAMERGEFLPGEGFLKALEERFGVNGEWLRSGKGNMFEGDADRLKESFAVPVIGSGADQKTTDIICFPGVPDGSAALRITDESMYPLLRCGDYVVFAEAQDLSKIAGQLAVIRTNWERLLVRRIHAKEGRLFLVPENGEYESCEFQPDVHRVVGRTIYVVRILPLD